MYTKSYFPKNHNIVFETGNVLIQQSLAKLLANTPI